MSHPPPCPVSSPERRPNVAAVVAVAAELLPGVPVSRVAVVLATAFREAADTIVVGGPLGDAAMAATRKAIIGDLAESMLAQCYAIADAAERRKGGGGV